MFKSPAGDVLRTVTPLINGPVCHRCHGTDHRINGVLIIDRSLGPLHKAVLSSRAQVIAGSAAAVFALLGTLGLAVERLVLTRLRRLRKAARELGRGNLSARSTDKSSDELGELVHDFNAMAEDLATAVAGHLLGRQPDPDAVRAGLVAGLIAVAVPKAVLLVSNDEHVRRRRRGKWWRRTQVIVHRAAEALTPKTPRAPRRIRC